MNKSELREKITNTSLKSEKIFIPGWETEVIIKELNGKQYVDVASNCLSGNKVDQTKFLTYAIIYGTYDLEGEQIFSEEDTELVTNLPADIYSQFVTVISRLNNLDGNSNRKN
jgi:hypothetical protein